ncbi:MAG TPA: ATP synthase F1 subunit gamma [Candidatus Binataceae bacterium]|nr:ATP synthase F1 subunit gamma [Candidatus Binataceae bacterium]
MASLKAIRRRIASFKSTQQITRAMKLISAARLRRAQEALISARPYHEALVRIADSLFTSMPEALAPAEGAKRAALILVIASDRGLCGGYNINLVRRGEDEAARALSEGLDVRLYVVGRRALDHFRRANRAVAYDRINNPRLATFELAQDLAARMLAEYRGGEVVEVGVVYSAFHSALSQRPVYERLLPITRPEPAEGQQAAEPADYLIEPSPAELLPTVVRAYLEDSIFHGLLEAEASEHGARMTAMDSATSNAAKLIGRLTIEMNRARQATITRELMDIVGGAEALSA